MMSLATPLPGRSWAPGPACPQLSVYEVHVWRIQINLPDDRLRSLQQVLSLPEWDRARRFHFDKDRRRFIAAHGALRMIISRYLHTRPEKLVFSYNSYGKPALQDGAWGDKLAFNLSHSGDFALAAVALSREIGVDIEQIRPEAADGAMADRFFSPREATVFRALPEPLRVEGFFNCWTRKEAYIKAKGLGLSLPLDSFEVSLIPGEPAVLLRVLDDPGETRRWALRALDPAPGYAGAACVEGFDWEMQCWDWSGGEGDI